MFLEFSSEFNKEFDIKTFDKKKMKQYIIHLLKKYIDKSLKNYFLWKIFHTDFADFQNDDFAKINIYTWNDIKFYCYFHGFWIENDNAVFINICFHNVLQSDWKNWTEKQIKWIKNKYNTLFKKIRKKKERLNINSKMKNTIISQNDWPK